MVKVTLRRSPIGADRSASAQTLRGLGLTRVGKTVIVQDDAADARHDRARSRTWSRWRAETMDLERSRTRRRERADAQARSAAVPAPGTARPRAAATRAAARARAATRPPGYEGGQMPLQRRLPKRGFRNPFRARVRDRQPRPARRALRRRRGGRSRRRCAARGLVRGAASRSSCSARATLTQGAHRQGARLQRSRRKQRIDAAGGSAEVIDGA